MNLCDLAFSFVFFSLLGWLLEVAYRSAGARRFVNPGLLRGPYLVLYGAGALVLMAAASRLEAAGAGLALRALVYLVLTTGLELVSGLVAERFFHVRLWDYSDQPLHFKGLVCPLFSLYWLILAFAFEFLLLPPYRVWLAGLPQGAKGLSAGVGLAVMLADFLAVAGRAFLRGGAEEAEAAAEAFRAAAGPVLAIPEVAALARYPHHRGKTRLDHVREVAWLSFLWGRRLRLDTEAIVRGALLHDLFFYDWLREGPRLHGLRHHRIALANARRVTRLSPKEADIILKHMWPLTLAPPRHLESLVVSLVDTYCSFRDYLSPAGARRRGAPGAEPRETRT
ncbi:phosphohydrolase [Dissulfurirhabdus thermomarina]|uniref:Phosphohydrolase n=1 Tax=Dissulfurirhabdus thermomarina TaxID=1765737 RepID=A0A6N9TQ81_DISTH|nr:HD domain-containing protein [Dissulfurirhabdus thermomarina]NDY41894.1 phosphohydrolase [Dissulfurirhabdus thermomarina]NMX23710.1 phosphohydrolase [Dissulfurirhabdus thermomarina]